MAMSRGQWLAMYPQYTSADYDKQFGTTSTGGAAQTSAYGGTGGLLASDTTTRTQGTSLPGTTEIGQTESDTGGGFNLGSTAYGGPTVDLNLNSGTPYKRPAGIPAYDGYQPPDYGNTTPNSTHWLNTMNAYAPNARTDMARLLGQGGAAGDAGGSSGGGLLGGSVGGGMARAPSPMTGSYRPDTGWQTGNTQGAYTPSILTPEQQASNFAKAPTPYGSTGLLGGPTTTAQPATQPATQPVQNQGTPFPTQWERAGAPGYMDAFWNTPGGYAPPTQQTTQNAYTQPATNSWANPTIGIDAATGSLTFL